MRALSVTLLSLYSSFFGFTIAELQKGSLCDPEGTLREFTTFEKVIHGAAYEKCVCNVGYYGRYCERIFRCISGRPFAINCTEPPRAFESSTQTRCAITADREIDVCLCFIGYQGNRCEQTVNPLPMRIGTIRISPLPVKKDSEESREYDGNGRLGIVSSDFKEIIEEEKGRSLERRFWYLAFCFALAGVLAVLLIALYFCIMQAIYKAGLKHLTERELRRRIRTGKGEEDTVSLPPSYEDVQEQQKFLQSMRRTEEVHEPRPSVSSTIETAVSIENIANNSSDNLVQPQFRQLYVHV